MNKIQLEVFPDRPVCLLRPRIRTHLSWRFQVPRKEQIGKSEQRGQWSDKEGNSWKDRGKKSKRDICAIFLCEFKMFIGGITFFISFCNIFFPTEHSFCHPCTSYIALVRSFYLSANPCFFWCTFRYYSVFRHCKPYYFHGRNIFLPVFLYGHAKFF